MPIIRPVACFDKMDIMDIARKIDTYEISIRPFEDCCTIFTPKNPVTKPTLEKALETLQVILATQDIDLMIDWAYGKYNIPPPAYTII